MLDAGVLNTDNMSILGLTIDYGPFGFMDRSALACPLLALNSQRTGGLLSFAVECSVL